MSPWLTANIAAFFPRTQIVFDSIAASISMTAVACSIWIGFGSCASYLQVHPSCFCLPRTPIVSIDAVMSPRRTSGSSDMYVSTVQFWLGAGAIVFILAGSFVLLITFNMQLMMPFTVL